MAMYKIISGLHQMPFIYILSYITIFMKNISGRKSDDQSWLKFMSFGSSLNQIFNEKNIYIP